MKLHNMSERSIESENDLSSEGSDWPSYPSLPLSQDSDASLSEWSNPNAPALLSGESAQRISVSKKYSEVRN